MAQHVTKADGSFDYDTIYAGTYTSDVLVETGQDESGNPVFTQQTITQTGPGYDAAGNILGYRVTDSSGVTSSYNMTLARFEGYKEAAVSGFRSDTGEVRTSTNQYDVNGHLVGITDDTGVDTAHRQFVNDANGIVLQKTQQANVADSPIPADLGTLGSGTLGSGLSIAYDNERPDPKVPLPIAAMSFVSLVLVTGEKERPFMSRKIKYTDEPLEAQVIQDFLPPPEELAFREEGVKVTLALSKKSVDFFKAEAGKHHTQYQRMIRKLIDSYVDAYSKPGASQKL